MYSCHYHRITSKTSRSILPGRKGRLRIIHSNIDIYTSKSYTGGKCVWNQFGEINSIFDMKKYLRNLNFGLLNMKWMHNLSLIRSLIDFINSLRLYIVYIINIYIYVSFFRLVIFLFFGKFFISFNSRESLSFVPGRTFLKVTSTIIDQSFLSAIVDLVFGEFCSLKDLALNHVSRRIGRDRENSAPGLDREALRNEVNCRGGWRERRRGMPLLRPRSRTRRLRRVGRRRRRWDRCRRGKREKKVDFNTAYFIHAYNPGFCPLRIFIITGLSSLYCRGSAGVIGER